VEIDHTHFYTLGPEQGIIHPLSKPLAILEMWANAQRDGRPAAYKSRPLFNAAKFG